MTRREGFDAVIPWATLCRHVEPHYTKPGRGRRPLPLKTMLRVYFLQQWFDLSDTQAEDMLYDSDSMHRFARLELGDHTVPDESTILRFRHLLEQHQLTTAMFDAVKALLPEKRFLLKAGTIVDATIIAAPSSTKNATRTRDPEMKHTRKGNQWYFGMKIHVGTDTRGVVHALTATDAAQADLPQLPHLVLGHETTLCGVKAYYATEDMQQCELSGGRYRVRKSRKRTAQGDAISAGRSRIRAYGEHAFKSSNGSGASQEPAAAASRRTSAARSPRLRSPTCICGAID